MLIYENPHTLFSSSSYDQTYSNDLYRFSHKVTFEAIDTLFSNYLELGTDPFQCVDIGCGQGQVSNKVKEVVLGSGGNSETSGFYGVDISKVAIDQCHERYPELSWITDSFQEFLGNEYTHTKLLGKVDLVINKGGLTHVKSQDGYLQTLEGISGLLKDGGFYLFVKNKSFYRKWSNSVCKKWSSDADIFDLALKTFENYLIIPNSSYYIILYRKALPITATGSRKKIKDENSKKENIFHDLSEKKPTWIIFKTAENKVLQKVYVSGDELSYKRINRFLPLYKDNEVLPSYDVPVKFGDRKKQKLLNFLEQSKYCYSPDKKNLFLVDSNILLENLKSINFSKLMFENFKDKFNLILYPQRPKNTRKYCEFIDAWLREDVQIYVLGYGIEDYWINSKTNLPFVDIDEFTYRLNYIFEKLSSETSARVFWLQYLPQQDFSNPSKGWYYTAKVAKPYSDVIASACQKFDYVLCDVTHLESSPSSSLAKVMSPLVKQLSTRNFQTLLVDKLETTLNLEH